MARRRQKHISTVLFRATTSAINHEGKGIARINGKTTFIQGALANEEVDFIYTRKKNHYDEGLCREVIKPANARVVPPCVHYDLCGGCSMQHVAPDAQIALKQSVLLEKISHSVGYLPSTILPPLTDKTKAYRNKARLSVRYVEKKQSALVGFRERLAGRFVADIHHCYVLDERVGLKIDDLRVLIASLNAKKDIAQIEVAAGDNEVGLIIRHLVTLDEHDKKQLMFFAKQHQLHLYLQPQGPDSVYLLYPKSEHDYLSYHLPAFDLTFYFHPTDFTQVNPAMNAKMVSQAIRLLAPFKNETILDLFCGLGNFSLAMARLAKQVVGVEVCKAMVERAMMNANYNGINNVVFYDADLNKPFEEQHWAAASIDKILIDPPRTGAYEIVKKIQFFNARKIVYVSCQAATLARDAEILVKEHGYQLVSAGVMDMFPHTSHVESIVLFEKK